MNHLRTRRARFAGSGSRAGAAKIEGCSVQHDGISVTDFCARTKGGAPVLERSPLIVDRNYPLSTLLFAEKVSGLVLNPYPN